MDTQAPLDVILSVRVEVSLRDELKELAEKNERRFGDQLRKSLRLGVMSERLSEEEAA